MENTGNNANAMVEAVKEARAAIDGHYGARDGIWSDFLADVGNVVAALDPDLRVNDTWVDEDVEAVEELVEAESLEEESSEVIA